MALTAVQQNMISNAAKAAEQLRQLKGTLEEINYLYNGVPNYKNTIVQADLDALPSLAGLTKAELDGGVNALTGAVFADVIAAINSLIVLAVRS